MKPSDNQLETSSLDDWKMKNGAYTKVTKKYVMSLLSNKKFITERLESEEQFNAILDKLDQDELLRLANIINACEKVEPIQKDELFDRVLLKSSSIVTILIRQRRSFVTQVNYIFQMTISEFNKYIESGEFDIFCQSCLTAQLCYLKHHLCNDKKRCIKLQRERKIKKENETVGALIGMLRVAGVQLFEIWLEHKDSLYESFNDRQMNMFYYEFEKMVRGIPLKRRLWRKKKMDDCRQVTKPVSNDLGCCHDSWPMSFSYVKVEEFLDSLLSDYPKTRHEAVFEQMKYLHDIPMTEDAWKASMNLIHYYFHVYAGFTYEDMIYTILDIIDDHRESTICRSGLIYILERIMNDIIVKYIKNYYDYFPESRFGIGPPEKSLDDIKECTIELCQKYRSVFRRYPSFYDLQNEQRKYLELDYFWMNFYDVWKLNNGYSQNVENLLVFYKHDYEPRMLPNYKVPRSESIMIEAILDEWKNKRYTEDEYLMMMNNLRIEEYKIMIDVIQEIMDELE